MIASSVGLTMLLLQLIIGPVLSNETFPVATAPEIGIDELPLIAFVKARVLKFTPLPSGMTTPLVVCDCQLPLSTEISYPAI
ncbi:hypothetical protein D3C85_1383290 [compost metagenome]